MDADRSLFEEAQRHRRERARKQRIAGKCYVCHKRPRRPHGGKCKECHAARERITQRRRDRVKRARQRAERAAKAAQVAAAERAASRPKRTKPRRGQNPAYDLELQG